MTEARRRHGRIRRNGDAGQAVVAGVRDLLPVLRERAQETEDARVGARRVGQGAGRDRVLPAAPAGRFGGLEADR